MFGCIKWNKNLWNRYHCVSVHACVDASECVELCGQWCMCVNIQLYLHTEICEANAENDTVIFTRN